VMYFRTPLAPVGAKGGVGAGAAAGLCGLLTVLIGLYPGPLMRASDYASRRGPQVRQQQRHRGEEVGRRFDSQPAVERTSSLRGLPAAAKGHSALLGR